MQWAAAPLGKSMENWKWQHNGGVSQTTDRESADSIESILCLLVAGAASAASSAAVIKVLSLLLCFFRMNAVSGPPTPSLQL